MRNHPPNTYTTAQAMQVLGIKSRSAFHHLKNQYPEAFKVSQLGTGRSRFTFYDKDALDRFVLWRNQYKKG